MKQTTKTNKQQLPTCAWNGIAPWGVAPCITKLKKIPAPDVPPFCPRHLEIIALIVSITPATGGPMPSSTDEQRTQGGLIVPRPGA